MLRSKFFFAGGEYQIGNSLRFNDDDSAYLSRTPATTGDRKIFTFSAWVKRGNLGAIHYILSAHATSRTAIRFNADDSLYITFNSAIDGDFVTSAVYRDPSAHMHLVVSVDTTQATASNRVKLYVNGSQVTSFSSAVYPVQNYLTDYNEATTSNQIGVNGTTTHDGLLSEVNFIDGQALDTSYFGKTDLATGVWIPKKYGGTYGTAGFYLPFNDATSTTTLGYDRSGNGNNWTLTNFATSDQLTDTPTNNYCTLSSIDKAGTLSDGNLSASNNNQLARSTFWLTSGKWYWEFTPTSVGNVMGVAINRFECPLSGPTGTGNGYGYLNTGEKTDFGANYSYGNSFIANDVIGIAFDADTKTLWFSKNGTWQNGATAAEIAAGTTTNAAYTGIANVPWSPAFTCNVPAAGAMNFGQRPFTYTAPAGFKSLCTDNLSVPSIKKPGLYFKPVIYTGNGAARSITGVGFQPDLTWVKSRSAATSHYLYDSVRGVQNRLHSNSTDVEATNSGLTSFGADGFGLGADINTNTNGDTYVAWNFKKGVTPGFDIVGYTGTGTVQTVAHSLGVAPGCVIYKNRSVAADWAVYHIGDNPASQPQYGKMLLNSTAAFSGDGPIFNDTAPSSSVFTVGVSALTNTSGNNYVAYLFAEVSGFSRIGRYTGNGSADGPFVWCGFKPKYVMIKRTDVVGYGWAIRDTARDTYNASVAELAANYSNAEGVAGGVDFLGNGWKLRLTDPAYNASGGNYIFVAFAEYPLKYAKAG